jgi:DNA repair protein RecO (recombination protein O)
MSLITTDAIVLHSFDYMESSRIVRLVTRDAGLRSAIARGIRKSTKRFGGGLNLFAEGTVHLHAREGRELDALAGFESQRVPAALGEDLGRFAGASALAELTLRVATEASADVALYDSVREALHALELADPSSVAATTITGGWRIVQALGYAPSLESCVECDEAIPDDASALFSLSAGGVVCADCAGSRGGRVLPPDARRVITAWLVGGDTQGLTDSDVRAHQRLFHEFVSEHLIEGRPTPAIDLWYGGLGGKPAG